MLDGTSQKGKTSLRRQLSWHQGKNPGTRRWVWGSSQQKKQLVKRPQAPNTPGTRRRLGTKDLWAREEGEGWGQRKHTPCTCVIFIVNVGEPAGGSQAGRHCDLSYVSERLLGLLGRTWTGSPDTAEHLEGSVHIPGNDRGWGRDSWEEGGCAHWEDTVGNVCISYPGPGSCHTCIGCPVSENLLRMHGTKFKWRKMPWLSQRSSVSLTYNLNKKHLG